jgi:hypothetical protein
MKYADFSKLISQPRMNRYLLACANNTDRTMALYQSNLKLSQEMFSILSVFEIVLRNKIDAHYRHIYSPIIGNDEWLRYAANPCGFYALGKTHHTQESIQNAIRDLGGSYSHNKLLAELNFGFWRFQFASKEFQAAGSSLHQIFVNRPARTNHTAIFNKLKFINNIRNRIAHHEPICFDMAGNSISTLYVSEHYQHIFELLSWMNIDGADLYDGIDGIEKAIETLEMI